MVEGRNVFQQSLDPDGRLAQAALIAHVFHHEGGIGLAQLCIFPAQGDGHLGQLVDFVGEFLEF